MFWLLAAWLTTVGLSSIIPQIFWPGGAAQGARGACTPALRELRRELLARASEDIARASAADPAQREARLAWFESWDQRLFRTLPGCREQEERAAIAALGRLRHGLQALLERFQREQAPRIELLEQLLGKDGMARSALARPAPERPRTQPLEDESP